MRILVWGLGYVGTVSAACFAQLGHEVVGIEPNAIKVEAINAGQTAIKELGLDALIAEAVAAGTLRATTESDSLIEWADVSLICVGTPSAANGAPVLDYIEKVAAEIGRGLRQSNRYHTVVLRSTVFPGTVRGALRSWLEEHSGKRAGVDFGLASNPEFLREASAVSDFHAPPYTVIGAGDDRSGEVVAALYDGIQAPIFQVAPEEAELLKMLNNAFHALKIGFANEVGRLCEPLSIDSQKVMQMICADTKLNISTAYLRPGFAFGGSCLPKDLRSLGFHSQRLGVELPILSAVLPSNRIHIEAARIKVHELNARRIAILGLSFKPGTDDLRESPILNLIRDLWQDGLDLTVYDPDVQLDKMLGGNRDYLERQLPQIDRIIRPTLDETLAQCEAVVVSHHRPEFVAALETLPGNIAVIDLTKPGEPRSRAAAQ